MAGRSLELLDFPRIRELVAGFCRTQMGKEPALGMLPRADPEWVAEELDKVDELLALGEEPSLSEVVDVRDLLTRARQGAALSGKELLNVKQVCAGIRRCRQFFSRRRDRIPKVWLIARLLVEQAELEQAVEKALDDAGEVCDTATPRLKQTRQELRRRRNKLVSRLEHMAADHPDWFTDRPTVRRDRFVLPVRIEARDRVTGVIHESSGTGHTLFVEPMETVGEQNELAELRGIEVEEVARILRSLSDLVAEREQQLRASLTRTGKIDLLLAKRRFALEFDCKRPEITDDGGIQLVAGRHPLLVRRKVRVVPLDFGFPEDAQVVLISGPNAGGKTVAIKTLGLLSLMMGCGMHLPVGDGARLPLFREVFADIGDEQSLDSDLSSFTAHMTRLKGILEQADEHSLVLLDEIGSSTAPEEGVALAIAVLEILRNRGVRTVATSHFGVLKVFVQDQPGMVNAAMGFQDGQPTYRLTIGFPGESSAFEIAAGVGLPDELLEKAQARLGREWLDLSTKLRDLNQELEQARVSRQTASEEQARAERLRLEYEEKLVGLRQRAADEQQRLRAEQETFLRETRREVENLVRQIKESQAEHEAVVKAKRYVEDRLKQVTATAAEVKEKHPSFELTVGDVVESRMFQRRGVVADIRRDQVTVAFGQIRMQLSADDLTLVQSEVRQKQEVAEPGESYSFEPKLSIRGMTKEQASEAVSRFLDEAGCFRAKQLAILHGKGTGALQRMLWDRLRKDPRVEELRFGEEYQGGSGVTLLTLRMPRSGSSEKNKEFPSSIRPGAKRRP